MRTDTPTVSEVVHEAVALTDPTGHDDAVASLLTAFEDDDRPVQGVDDIAEVLGSTASRIDPDDDSPGTRVAAAVAAFLAASPAGGDDRPGTLRVAVRTAYGDDVPEPVRDWLA